MDIDVLKYYAEQADLTFISESNRKRYCLYKLNKCGHIKEIRDDKVKLKQFFCKECLNEKLENEAKKAGLLLISNGKNKNYRLYECLVCGARKEYTTVSVRKGDIECQQCKKNKEVKPEIVAQLKKEAELAGLEYLRACDGSKYNLYRFLNCNHIQEIRPSHVKDKHFRCKTCLELKLRNEAENFGLDLVGQGKNKDYRIYKFKHCGHQQEIQVKDVRRNSFKCRECYELKLRTEADKARLLIVKKGRIANSFVYQFKDCGHEKELQASSVRRQVPYCEICCEENLKSEAESAGLILLGKTDDARYRLYKFIKCGHEQKIQTGNVRNYSFKCSECNSIRLTNGVLVRSMAEFYVGEFLIENNIKFEYEKKLSQTSKHLTDYYLCNFDLYIEVVGYENNYNGYMDKLNKKINKYYKNKNLLCITYSEITLRSDWRNKILNKISELKNIYYK